MSQDFSFSTNQNTSYSDLAVSKQNPALVLSGQETSGVYCEEREVAGTLYRAFNAQWNIYSQKWQLVNTANAAFAEAINTSGAHQYLYAPSGVSPFTWQVVSTVDKSGNASFTAINAPTVSGTTGSFTNVNANTVSASTFSGQLSSATDYSALTVYNVKFYKQASDPDDTLSFSRAATAINTAARGGVLFIPDGTYSVTSLPTFNVPYVRVVGASLWGTLINVTSANANGFRFIGTSNAPAKYCSLENVFIQNTSVASSTSNVGLSLSYAKEFRCRSVQIADFLVGVNQATSPNCLWQDALCSYSGTGAGSGWVVDGASGGNVSSTWRDCAFAGTSASQSTFGWRFYSSASGGDCGDLNLFNCNSSFTGTGIQFDFSNTNATTSTDCSSDIILRDTVHDEFYQYGIQVLNGNSTSLVKIQGGYFNANNGSSTDCVGIYTTAPTMIIGAEFIPVQTPFGHNAFAMQFAAGSDGSIVNGCSLNGWTRGVYVNGGSPGTANNINITGSRFFSTPNSGFGITMTPVSAFNCNNLNIVGNMVSASSSGQISQMYIDSTCTNTNIVGNSFNANVTTKITNSSTTSNIADNFSYNPQGATVTDASVGSSPWAYTNQTGLTIYAYVSGGTVSAITIDGRATGLVSGMFIVPPGKAMVVTYSVAPTVHFVGS